MSIKLQLPKVTELRPRLTVIGVGGAGGNAVNNMIAAGLTGVDFVVANTDAQALLTSSAEHRIQLGVNLTEGLGAGSKPEIGEAAAEEAIEEIRSRVTGSHMVFVAAGMGGGTGTGAAAVIARIAQEEGVLVVGIVTKPFQFEGARRMRMAEAGIAELKSHVDTLIVIPNQNLFRIANEKTTFAEAFVLADQVLYSGISCIVDLIIKEGLINLDFADVRTILSNMGSAMMGTGEASGERRAILAAEEAITNPLLDEISLKGAKGLLLSIIGGRNLTLYEVDEAASRVRQEVDGDANIIVGATFDETLGDRVRVSIVASGMDKVTAAAPPQVTTSAVPPAPAVSAPHASAASLPPPIPGAPVSPPQPLPNMSLGRAMPPPVDAQPRLDINQPQSSRAAMPPSRAIDSAPSMPAYEEELSHRLSAAMDAEDPYGPDDDGAPNDTRPDPASTIAGAPWRAPGDVYIEEGPPQLTPAPAPKPQLPPQQRQPQSSGVAFEPAAPGEIRRPPARRMPEIGDFPPVGQRDYHAKAPQNGGAQQPQHQQPHAPQRAPSPPAESQRKPGLFERLTGRVRRNDSPEPQRDSRQAPPPPATQARAPATAAPRPPVQQRPPSAADRALARRVAGGQAVELPVFFNKDGK